MAMNFPGGHGPRSPAVVAAPSVTDDSGAIVATGLATAAILALRRTVTSRE